MINRETGLRSGGALNWFLQRISGAVLLIALIVHFWVLHFYPPAGGEITFDTVMQRLQNPLWRAMDLVFLVAGLYHGANGMLMLIHDYVRAAGIRIALVGVLWIGALFYLIVGSMTILGLAAGGLING